MNILSVNTLDHGGGAEKIARDLAAGYRRRGHAAWLAVGHRRSDDPSVLAIPLDRAHRPRNPEAPEPLPPEAIRRELLHGAEDIFFPGTWDLLDLPPVPPDVLHLHNLHGGYFDLRALPSLGRRTPVVLTQHDAWLASGHCAHSFACERWRSGCGACPDLALYPAVHADRTAENRRLKQTVLGESRLHLATPCDWLMERLTAVLPAAALADARVIRGGVDLAVFRPGDRAAARARFGIPADARVLLFAANGIRGNPWKDYAGLRAVLAGLAERRPDARFVLIGLGENAPPERVGRAVVSFVPFQGDPAVVADFFRAADLYLHMARAETFPNVVLEALACGTPVAATAVGGIAEQVLSLAAATGTPVRAHGPEAATGVLAAPGDAAGLADRIVALFDEPGLPERLGRNGAEDARRRFDRERMITEYLDWFERIVRVRKMPGEASATTPAASSGPVRPGWLDTLAGALAAGRPVSRRFGTDRGTPVDRVYIERFLAANAAAVRGRVLEIGDAAYTRRFGGDRVSRSDVLHATPDNPQATIVGDLASEGDLPAAAFDCVILTQTLHCLADPRAALTNAARILAPGGVLLATLPGITPISRYDMERWGDYWRLTGHAAAALFGAAFPGASVTVSAYGNAATATAFLNGLAAEELPPSLFETDDPDYEVTVAVRVERPPPAPAVRGGAAGSRVPAGRPLILMYHRVAELPSDPQLLAVTPARFLDQMTVLSRSCVPLSLGDMLRRLADGTLPAGAVAVTFDDGYADNLVNAAPRLAAHAVPATVFVTSGMIGSDREFWWDELERLILAPGRLPPTLTLAEPGGNALTVALADDALWTEAEAMRHAAWTVLDTADPTPRHTLYRRLHRALHHADPAARRQALEALARWCGREPQGRPSHRTMTAAEVAALAADGLVTIGAHTVDHPRLSALPAQAQRGEIAGSRDALGALLGRPPDLFAYPYGSTDSFTDETVALVRGLGFRGAVTTAQAPLVPDADPFRLPRLLVRNWPADVFERVLTGFRQLPPV